MEAGVEFPNHSASISKLLQLSKKKRSRSHHRLDGRWTIDWSRLPRVGWVTQWAVPYTGVRCAVDGAVGCMWSWWRCCACQCARGSYPELRSPTPWTATAGLKHWPSLVVTESGARLTCRPRGAHRRSCSSLPPSPPSHPSPLHHERTQRRMRH